MTANAMLVLFSSSFFLLCLLVFAVPTRNGIVRVTIGISDRQVDPFATINIFALGILLHSANGSMEFHPLAWNVSYRKQVFYSQNCSARNRIILST